MRWIALAVLAAACAQQGHGPSGDDATTPPLDHVPGLGAHWTPDGSAVDFRVASTRATRIELSIYAEPDGVEVKRVELARDADVWSVRIPASELPRVGAELAVRRGVGTGLASGTHRGCRHRWQPVQSEQGAVRSVRARAVA
jgi:hypothetical protein